LKKRDEEIGILKRANLKLAEDNKILAEKNEELKEQNISTS
jgi:hypothetical protein